LWLFLCITLFRSHVSVLLLRSLSFDFLCDLFALYSHSSALFFGPLALLPMSPSDFAHWSRLNPNPIPPRTRMILLLAVHFAIWPACPPIPSVVSLLHFFHLFPDDRRRSTSSCAHTSTPHHTHLSHSIYHHRRHALACPLFRPSSYCCTIRPSWSARSGPYRQPPTPTPNPPRSLSFPSYYLCPPPCVCPLLPAVLIVPPSFLLTITRALLVTNTYHSFPHRLFLSLLLSSLFLLSSRFALALRVRSFMTKASVCVCVCITVLLCKLQLVVPK